MTDILSRYVCRTADGRLLIFDTVQGVYIYNDDGLIEYTTQHSADVAAAKMNA